MKQIELIDISKVYDKRTRVLDKINLEVEQGEFFILVGPSGCGKSTLLRMIAGLESITDGVLKMNGSIANLMLPKDRGVSMVFQNYALYPHMTVRENILFGLDVKKIKKAEQEKRLAEVAEMIGLTEYLQRKPGQLSGGQRQRVALARSICSEAAICLMDEPLSNLDAKLRAQMRTEIRRIQKQLNLTIVYVTHDQVEAMTMGDRIMVLHAGSVQQVGTPLELYNAPANQFVASFIGSPQMNMAECIVEGNEFVLNGDVRVKIQKEAQGTIPQGQKFAIGIRAENLGRAQNASGEARPVVVANIELMGNETQILFKVGEQMFTARWQGQWNIAIGDTVFVEFRAQDYHFFDCETGELLRPAILAQDTENYADAI